jgi:hypothetical protein
MLPIMMPLLPHKLRKLPQIFQVLQVRKMPHNKNQLLLQERAVADQNRPLQLRTKRHSIDTHLPKIWFELQMICLEGFLHLEALGKRFGMEMASTHPKLLQWHP